MFKVRTLNKISSTGLSTFGAGYRISDDEARPDAIILRSFKMHDMELPEGLRVVARAGAGVNNIPIDKCTQASVVVFNTPGANANAVKELVICGLMLSARKIWQGINWVQAQQGNPDVPALVEKEKANFGGGEILGKTMGIIGISGAIGLRLANACYALGMKVVGVDESAEVSSEVRAALHPEIRILPLEEVLAASDFVSLNLPFNNKTKHMINADLLAKFKKGAVLVNMARAEIVDDAALKTALAGGQIATYVTDFPNGDLLGLDNVIAIPHLGASTDEAEENCALMAVAQTRDYLERGNIVNSVNYPTVTTDGDGVRLCITYNSAHPIADKIHAVLSAEGHAYDFYDATRGPIGYAIALLDEDADGHAVSEDLQEMPGILDVRVL